MPVFVISGPVVVIDGTRGVCREAVEFAGEIVGVGMSIWMDGEFSEVGRSAVEAVAPLKKSSLLRRSVREEEWERRPSVTVRAEEVERARERPLGERRCESVAELLREWLALRPPIEAAEERRGSRSWSDEARTREPS